MLSIDIAWTFGWATIMPTKKRAEVTCKELIYTTIIGLFGAGNKWEDKKIITLL